MHLNDPIAIPASVMIANPVSFITQKLLIRDRGKIAVTGGEMTFACGVQKPRAVTIGFKPLKDPAKGTAGEVTAIDLK